MNYYAFIGLFNGVVGLLLSFYLFAGRKQNSLYVSFSALCLSIGLWSIFYALWQVQADKDAALFCSRLLMIFCYFIPFSFLWFVCNLVGIQLKRWQSSFLLGIPLCLALFGFSRFAVKDVVSRISFPFWPVPGILVDIYFLSLFFTVLFAFALLFRAYGKAEKFQKWQIRWVFLTFLPIWAGGMTNIPLWYNIPVYPLPNFFVGMGLLVLFYAITRARLFDVSALADAIQTAKLTALGVIAASINHEIRNPLYVIKGLAETLAERAVDPLANKEQVLAKAKEIAEKTIVQSDRVLGIIKSFSSYAKRETDKVYEKQRVRVKEVVEHILPFIESELGLKKITIRQEIPEGLEVFADVQSLEEIFINLIVNACQAMSHSPSENSKVNGASPGNLQSKENKGQGMPGGGEIKISATLSRPGLCATKTGSLQGDVVTITIQDTGPGIPKEHLSHIFEPFYTTKASGIGLGLYVVKQLVEKSDGKVKVSSKEGLGTTFTLVFPK